jgi:nitrate/TMAO reductase-like tetraheme cytochrome c subunit
MNRLLQLPLTLTRGGIAGLLALLVLTGVGVFVVAARTINTAPAQCATCHPTVTTLWQQSRSHPAEKVGCAQCHAPHPALPQGVNVAVQLRDALIPERYRNLPERLEARCEGCHDAIRGAAEEAKKIIRINHQLHLTTGRDPAGQPLGMTCLDCHRSVAHELGPGATNRPRMSGCFAGSCHAEDRNDTNCRRCHYQQLTEPPDVL